MAESFYQTWLNQEAAWIGAYCKRTRRNSVFKIIPATLLLLALLFAGFALLNDGGVEGAIWGAVGGLVCGFIICALFLLILLLFLHPSRYVGELMHSVDELDLTEREREKLGEEMLAALADPTCVYSFKMKGPGSGGAKSTPARFLLTPHYAFLEGGTPYANLVRLSDIAEVKPSFQRDFAADRVAANTKIYRRVTIYTIGFYRKDRFDRGLTGNDLPDEAMGFFQETIRDNVLNMLKNAGVRIG